MCLALWVQKVIWQKPNHILHAVRKLLFKGSLRRKTRNDAPTWYLYTNLYCPALVLPKVGFGHSEKGQDGGWAAGRSCQLLVTGHCISKELGRVGCPPCSAGTVFLRGHPPAHSEWRGF